MREIKLRSWNEEKQKFYYLVRGRYFDDDGKCVSERICKEFNWSNAEEYTGLKDKDDKEIYGGDIVERKSDILSQYFINEILFSNGCFCIVAKDLVTNEFSNQPLSLYIPKENNWDYDIIKIGNINENPELLK